MGTVFIDGEKVDFEGPAPATRKAACELIDGFLSAQGRSIEGVSVDGAELPLEQALEEEGYRTIAFSTTTPQKQLLAMCREWSGQCDLRVAEAREMSISALRVSWDRAQGAVFSFHEQLRPLAEGLGILKTYGADSQAAWMAEFSPVFDAALATINRMADAIEARSCVKLSDCLADGVVPEWGAVKESLSKQVIPTLEAEVAS